MASPVSSFPSHMREISEWLERTFPALKCCDSRCVLPGVLSIAGLTNKVIGTVLIKEYLCVLSSTMFAGSGG